MGEDAQVDGVEVLEQAVEERLGQVLDVVQSDAVVQEEVGRVVRHGHQHLMLNLEESILVRNVGPQIQGGFFNWIHPKKLKSSVSSSKTLESRIQFGT